VRPRRSSRPMARLPILTSCPASVTTARSTRSPWRTGLRRRPSLVGHRASLTNPRPLLGLLDLSLAELADQCIPRVDSEGRLAEVINDLRWRPPDYVVRQEEPPTASTVWLRTRLFPRPRSNRTLELEDGHSSRVAWKWRPCEVALLLEATQRPRADGHVRNGAIDRPLLRLLGLDSSDTH
jgi:hypothetical protein